MKRRLTLAMGLINSPRLLFLDEPTSGLDVQSNLIIREVIRDLNKDGVTVFLTTHNIEEANLACDRVAIINRGRIAAIDSPERLKKTIQSVQSVEVAFEPAGLVGPAELGSIPHVSEVSKQGDKFRLITADPGQVFDGIMEFARAHDIKVIRVTTLGPSLEDVFIRLTGLDTRTRGEKPLTDATGWSQELSRELYAAWTIARKDILIYYLKPNIIVSGMFFPLFMFLAFAIGRSAAPGVMVPGLVAITILFSASSIEPVSIPIERRMKTFDRLLSAPISLHTVVLGESLSGFLYSLGISLVPLLAGILLFQVPVISIAPLVTGLLLTSFCFATMGTLFAAYPTESPGDIMSILNLVRLPLIFIPGVFIPIEQIPEAGRFIMFLSPLTYGNDLLKAAFSGATHFNPLVDIVMLSVFVLAFQFIANRLYVKFNE